MDYLTFSQQVEELEAISEALATLQTLTEVPGMQLDVEKMPGFCGKNDETSIETYRNLQNMGGFHDFSQDVWKFMEILCRYIIYNVH